MQRLLLLACLAACHAASPPAHPSPASKLGPNITKAELDARLADHRLHDGADLERTDASAGVANLFDGRELAVDGNLITYQWCRPGGLSIRFLVDEHYVYSVASYEPGLKIFNEKGEAQATPSTYCSLETLKIPAGLTYGGALTVQ